jgi:hypothetical protein
MLPEGWPVLLYTGKPKSSQWGYLVVVDLDVGTSDLQQCADLIMRVRAEYLWSLGRASQVNQLSANPKHWDGGDWKAYRRYRNGVMAKTGTLTMAARMKRCRLGIVASGRGTALVESVAQLVVNLACLRCIRP